MLIHVDMTGAFSNAGAVKMRSREAKRQTKKRIPRTAGSSLKCLTRWPPLAWVPPPYPPRSPHNIFRCATVCLSVCLSVCPSMCLSVHPCVCLSIRVSFRLSVCQPPYDPFCSPGLCVHPSAEESWLVLRSQSCTKSLDAPTPLSS